MKICVGVARGIDRDHEQGVSPTLGSKEVIIQETCRTVIYDKGCEEFKCDRDCVSHFGGDSNSECLNGRVCVCEYNGNCDN